MNTGKERIWMAALKLLGIPLGVFLAVYIVFWPVKFYHGGIRWLGEGLWVAFLLVSAAVFLFAMDSAEGEQTEGDKQKNQSQAERKVPKVDPDEREDDREVFVTKVCICLKDQRIVGYFTRKLVQDEVVTNKLARGAAFRQAREKRSYRTFVEKRDNLTDSLNENAEAISSGALGTRPVTAALGSLLFAAMMFVEINGQKIVAAGIGLITILLVGSAGRLAAIAKIDIKHRVRRRSFFLITALAALCTLILPYVLLGSRWPFTFFLTLIIIFGLCFLFSIEQTLDQASSLITLCWSKCITIYFLNREVLELQAKWLDDCVEDIIMPNAVLTINTLLGADKDRLLVEQDSEGLRRLQDPSFTVPTRSEQQIENVLSQMDGGSIALAGPRGAGKTTLLKKFSGPQRTKPNEKDCISVYLMAPAEYIPKDFIAELLQNLCEKYLYSINPSEPKPIFKERVPHNFRHILGRLVMLLWLCLRATAVIAIVTLVVRSLGNLHYHTVYFVTKHTLMHWYDNGQAYVYNKIYKKAQWVKLFWTPLKILMIVVALFFFPGPRLWKKYIRPHPEPALAKKAKEYLLRLQVDKTVTWGVSVGSPSMRGIGLSINRGGTARYVPWTFPELVSHTRSFMQAISLNFSNSSHAVVVGIDEIDRIGSLDHAEKFIGEIKAVFGIERCFFLVAVAEDVGSIFSERATTGRSILENAFDDVVTVDPLNFQETRDLLLKRVPGFIDSFAYLAHALSGGLPRELIRVTRRLVDINRELTTDSRYPRLEDLAVAIVQEQLIGAIRATRNQMSRLTLHTNWTDFFEKLRSASLTLQLASPFSVNESYGIIKELSEMVIPEAPEITSDHRPLENVNEEEAKRMVIRFTAFSYFGVTIIDAFRHDFFNPRFTELATTYGGRGSYEELAIARAELIVSPENSRAILRQFRDAAGFR